MPRSINITVPHSLPKAKAMNRVLLWLQSQEGQNAHVQSLGTVIDNIAGTITLKLSAYGYPVTATITVSDSQVELKTNEATDVVEWLAMWAEQMQLKKQLAEVLK